MLNRCGSPGWVLSNQSLPVSCASRATAGNVATAPDRRVALLKKFLRLYFICIYVNLPRSVPIPSWREGVVRLTSIGQFDELSKCDCNATVCLNFTYGQSRSSLIATFGLGRPIAFISALH